MKAKFYMNSKKISRKAAEELIGKERLEKRIKDAVETFREDPYIELSWMDGMEIRFEY